jgi:hypothetical protein
MIIFNTIKQAEHYVKWCQKTRDFNTGHYEWSSQYTYIKDNLVLQVSSGDSCGCGCDTGRYNNIYVIGRIKAYNSKTIRDSKLKKLIK